MKLPHKTYKKPLTPEQKHARKRFWLGFACGIGASALALLVGLIAFTASNPKQKTEENPSAVAHRQVYADTITDVTGLTFTFDDEPANLYVDTFAVNFDSNNTSFTGISISVGADGYTIRYSILNSGGGNDRYNPYRVGGTSWVKAYESFGWNNDAFKTLEFTGGHDATASDFISFLSNNGTFDGGASSSEATTSEVPTSSGSSEAGTTSEETSEEVQTVDFQVPQDYWPLQMFHASYDETYGGGAIMLQAPSDASQGLFSYTLGGILFRLGDSPKLFDRIRFWGAVYQGRDFINSSGNRVTLTGNEWLSYVYVSSIEVCEPVEGDNAPQWVTIASCGWYGSGGTQPAVNLFQFRFWDDNFRNFHVYPSSSPALSNFAHSGWVDLGSYNILNPALDALDRTQALKLAMTGTSANASPAIVIGGDGNADVFALLGGGFTAIASILNVQVLPYLTLGTLMFLPLVVVIVLALIKLLGK